MMHFFLTKGCLTYIEIYSCWRHTLEELGLINQRLLLKHCILLVQLLVHLVELGILLFKGSIRNLKSCNGILKYCSLFQIGNFNSLDNSRCSDEVWPSQIHSKTCCYSWEYSNVLVVDYSAVDYSRSHINDKIEPVCKSQKMKQTCTCCKFIVVELYTVKTI